MDKKSKVLLWVFGVLIIGSVGVAFWKFMIKKDYVIEAQADCDPTIEKCFVTHCDPTTDTTCTGDPEQDTTYYKNVDRIAANIPLCDPADESCQALVCPEGEKGCTVTFCDDQNKGKDGECSDPEQYNIDHPPADASAAACDPAQDPTCVDGATSDDGSDATATTDGTSTDNSDATAVH